MYKRQVYSWDSQHPSKASAMAEAKAIMSSPYEERITAVFVVPAGQKPGALKEREEVQA